MNAMTAALAEAGVKLPTQNERIWRFFKDHPNSTSSAAASRLKLPSPNVATQTADLEDRGMLVSKNVQMRVSNARGSFIRPIKHYTAVGDSFELQPRRNPRGVNKVKPAVALVPPSPAPVITTPPPAPAPTPKPTADHGVDVENLTLAQARALYADLKRVFG